MRRVSSVDYPEMAEALAERYPGVRIVWASLSVCAADKWIQQNIRFQAPLEVLRRHGLITDELLRRSQSLCLAEHGITPLGDGFSICFTRLDSQSRPGYVDFLLYTATTPREYGRRKSFRDAQRVLRRIAKRAGLPLRVRES